MKKTKSNIAILREQIDLLDKELLIILSRRFEVVREIGKLKKKNGLKALDKKRWNQIQINLSKSAKRLNLETKLIFCIYELIHEYSLKEQAKNQKNE